MPTQADYGRSPEGQNEVGKETVWLHPFCWFILGIKNISEWILKHIEFMFFYTKMDSKHNKQKCIIKFYFWFDKGRKLDFK